MPELNLELISGLAWDFAYKLVGFILIVIATFIVAGWVQRLILRSTAKSRIDSALGSFFSKMAKYAVLVLGGVSALGTFGVQTASFAAVLASAGFAVGMALQGTLGHFASGVMLLFFKPFRPGHFIQIAGTSGTVAEIDLFTTTLDTPDNRRIIVPNGKIYGSEIENVSHHPTRRVDVTVGADYAADIESTREVLLAAAKANSFLLQEPAPAAVLVDLGDSSVNWAVRIWVASENFWAAKDELTAQVKLSLDKAGIGIPFPQMELNLPESFTTNGGSAKLNH